MQYKYDHKVMECITAKVAKQVRGPSVTFCLVFPLSKSTPNTDTLCSRKNIQSSWKMLLGAKRLWNL